MEPQPLIVAPDGFLRALDGPREVIPVLAAVDPVQSVYFCAGGRIQKASAIGVPNQDRQDALIVPDRMQDLFVAHRRFYGVRADEEQECISPFDTPVDLLFPVFALWDTLPIHPGLYFFLAECIHDLLSEVKVSA
jgi:hypothetical protein